METVYPKGTGTKGERVVVEVPSFVDPGKTYEVTGETCTCPRYEFHRYCVKHPVLAEALLKARFKKSKIEREIAEVSVTSLCKRVFAVKRESASEAYELFTEVLGSRYATARMVEAARRRHVRARAMELGKAA